MTWDIILLHICTINQDHMMYGSWDIKCKRQSFFVIMGHFLHFGFPNNKKNQNLEKRNKAPGDIIILHLCTTKDGHMVYGSWNIKCDRQFFVILDQFLPFYPNYMLYCSWDMVCDWCNCYFSFWATFCPFTP